MPLESSIQKGIIDYLNSIPGCKAENISGDARSSGKADVLACLNGTMLRIEVKQPGNIASKKQLVNLEKWYRTGAFVMVAYSVEAVKQIIPKSGDRFMFDQDKGYTERPDGSWAKMDLNF